VWLLKLGNLEKEIRDFILNHQFKGLNVTLTMKQKVDEFWLDEISVDRNVRYFKNILNRKVFGNSYQRFNQQLKMLFVKEYSEDKRHHIHSVIEIPKRFEEEDFKELILDCWNRTLFGYSQSHIENPTSKLREVGWISYIMKSKTKVDLSESIDWGNSNFT
jgi:hypothetical protein